MARGRVMGNLCILYQQKCLVRIRTLNQILHVKSCGTLSTDGVILYEGNAYVQYWICCMLCNVPVSVKHTIFPSGNLNFRLTHSVYLEQ